MTTRAGRIAGVALFISWMALPAAADSQFRVRKMTRTDIPLGKGQCDIRLQVDNEAEITVRRDTVLIHTIAGRDARDDGSECNAPLPDREAPGFEFQVTEKRNEMVLLAEPSRRNNWAVVVRVRDSSGGEGRYTFRLSWRMTGGDDFGMPGRGPQPQPEERRGPPPPPWSNGLRFTGMGRGNSVLTAYGGQQLTEASVEIDRGGRLTVSMRGETEKPLVFSGTVVGAEGPRTRADVTTEDRRIRGAMFLTFGPRNEVTAINFEGSDQFGRLRVNWERR